jgi:hypothetical protein
MIHYTPEGHVLRVGLNITIGTWRKPYVTFRWVWYDTMTRNLSSRRFRIRLYQWPMFMWGRDQRNVVHGWLWENDFMIVPKTLLEDEAPRILAVAKLLQIHDYPPSLDDIVLWSSKDGKLSEVPHG